MHATQDKTNKQKKIYIKPQMKHLGKLSTIIQGITGNCKDHFPLDATTPRPGSC